MLRALLYSTNLALAYDYHLLGRSKMVGPIAAQRPKVQPPRADDEDPVLSHNLAVADLIEGKPVGEKCWNVWRPIRPNRSSTWAFCTTVAAKLQGARLYKRAAEKAPAPPSCAEWIDTKDRMIGSGQSPMIQKTPSHNTPVSSRVRFDPLWPGCVWL